MKAKSVVKIILDVILTVLFTLLLFAYSTGFVFHEIMGLSILFLFGLHLILNKEWIKAAGKKVFTGKSNKRTLRIYFLNVSLLTGVIVITVTGLLISTVIFPAGNYSSAIVFIHKWSAYITGILLVVHIAVHAKYMVSSFKKIYSNFNTPAVKRVFSGSFAAVMIAGTIYYSVITAVDKTISADLTGSQNNGGTQDSQDSSQSSGEISDKDEAISSSDSLAEEITLDEFLGNMFCNICHKRCPLSNPRCGKSKNLVSEATNEYQALYGDQ